jgi:hypothetical protein
MEIKKSYLMWVGHEHYDTMDQYAEEAGALGVSKRLPNITVAKSIAEEGTVVFVAHDEGHYRECPGCVSSLECPECRKAERRLEKAIDEWDGKREALRKTAPGKEREKLERGVSRVEKRIEKINAEMEGCELCDGAGQYYGGTGGRVGFGDGDAWDYRKFAYYLHQPAIWTPEAKDGAEIEVCKTCGGKGKLPEGLVFGFFVPSGIEYIAREEDAEEIKEMMRDHGAKIVEEATLATESRRGCGVRKPGGVYVTTDKDADGEAAKATLAKLVEEGAIKPDAAEVVGNFVKFLAPVAIDEKRFRGIKRWTMVEEAAEEVEMAAEAMED